MHIYLHCMEKIVGLGEIFGKAGMEHRGCIAHF